MTGHWTRETMRSELDAVSHRLEEPVTAYLVGGSAMVVREFKETTPDIDIVVPSASDIERLGDALTAAGYSRTTLRKTPAGKTTESHFQDDSGREVDLFNTRIHDGLVLSDGIRCRSDPYLETELADISVISPEDIYLSKLAHSGRLKDSADTTALSSAALDFDVVREELAAQNERVEAELPKLLLFGRPDET